MYINKTKREGCNASSPPRGTPWIASNYRRKLNELAQLATKQSYLDLLVNCITMVQTHGKMPSPYEDYMTRKLGPSIRVCQLNVEGISRAKCDLLHKILIDYDVDVLAIQETHTETEDQLRSRARIPGYELIGATYNRSYGTATYIRNTIENATLKRASTSNNIHEITIQVGEITVCNIYKPPAAPWPQHVSPSCIHRRFQQPPHQMEIQGK